MVKMRRFLILYTGLAGFVIYYGIHAFRSPWGGDFHAYLAVVHALYVDPWLPGHEAIAVEGAYSVMYSSARLEQPPPNWGNVLRFQS
jgi:hypothetical protein